MVAHVVCASLEQAGYEVGIIRSGEVDQGEFVRLEVSLGDQSTRLDLARDWRQFPPVPLDVGPVLHIDDAVGSKVTAMAGRGLPRDFVDVAAASARYTREELLGLAFTRDPGLRVVDFSYAMIALDRIPDGEFLPYGLGSEDVAVLRERYSAWPRDVAADPVGVAVRRAIVDNVT